MSKAVRKRTLKNILLSCEPSVGGNSQHSAGGKGDFPSLLLKKILYWQTALFAPPKSCIYYLNLRNKKVLSCPREFMSKP